MSGKIHLTGTITIPEDQQDKLLPLLREHIRLTRQETGCLEFEIIQDATRAEVFKLQELFENAEAFAYHQTRSRPSAWGIASVDLAREFRKTEI